MISLGENIKAARKKMGLTQEELASQIGVTSQAVSRWESGAGMPDVSMIVPIARVLCVSTDALFGVEHVNTDEVFYEEIKQTYMKIEEEALSPREAALKECQYMLEKVESDPVNYVFATCLAERTANFSRYVDFEDFGREYWPEIKGKAIKAGTQVIRFCKQQEWLERTHFALAWIYIHEKDYTSAREHISTLPSVANNRCQESILAQIASFEHGVTEMKRVMTNNLQNYTRVINKEILYAIEDISWHDEPAEAVEFGQWGIDVMRVLSRKRELLPYCRGFFRDIYKFMLHADLRAEDYDAAAMHWKELKGGMEEHIAYYQEVLEDDKKRKQFNDRQLSYMKDYTPEFAAEKRQKLLECLKAWHGEEKYARFVEKLAGEL